MVLTIFAIVKKHNLRILLPVVLATAVLNTSFHSVVKTDFFGTIPEKENTYSSSAFGYPQSEIEIFSSRTPGASQGNHGFKKVLGYLNFEAGKLLKSIFYLPFFGSPGLVSIKQYLSHIYPSHNFW